MIPESANLPDNAKWSDFDDDYTADEREELRELKRRWEDGLITNEQVVIEVVGIGRANAYLAAMPPFEAAKDILRGVR